VSETESGGELPLNVDELAELLRAAEKAHGEYEQRLGKRDEDWPSWYARYMVDRLKGR
jgi:hypothetical protein